MKISLICEGLHDHTIVAQPWKHVIELASRMEKLGIDVEIVSDKLPGKEESKEINSVPIKRVNKKGLFLDTKALAKLLDQEKPNIVNWHCSDVWSSFYFWRLRKKTDFNMVWTLHSGPVTLNEVKNLSFQDILQLHKFWNNFVSAYFPKTLIRCWSSVPSIKHIITLSKRTANRLVSFGIAHQKITCIPSGVDVDVFKPSMESYEDDSSILYFGPLSSFRGIDVLLAAYAEIRKRFTPARLVILARGAKPDRNWLKKTESVANLEIVWGTLNQEEVIRYVQRSSVVALPFKFWPQIECPSTILEAMSMGKAVVTTSIGGLQEIVQNGENGLVIPPNDSKKLANVILDLLKRPEVRDKMGKRARQHVEHFYDWRIITGNTMKVLSKYAE
ncbi:MAG: glycosyltransferase family 4 protein [Candidatus Bathyarchaeia archaeon]|jgi:glycosyltransferase involved in cell wall biosynthesis